MGHTTRHGRSGDVGQILEAAAGHFVDLERDAAARVLRDDRPGLEHDGPKHMPAGFLELRTLGQLADLVTEGGREQQRGPCFGQMAQDELVSRGFYN